MADPTMRDVLDQLATVQATVEQQGAELARYRSTGIATAQHGAPCRS